MGEGGSLEEGLPQAAVSLEGAAAVQAIVGTTGTATLETKIKTGSLVMAASIRRRKHQIVGRVFMAIMTALKVASTKQHLCLWATYALASIRHQCLRQRLNYKKGLKIGRFCLNQNGNVNY